MTVHAHPDDETISTGGIMARYAADGHRVVCVTCTGGEHGEIVVPELDTPENHARLAEIRRGELTRALSHLGPIDHHWLDYIDSGMMGRPENDAPGSFWGPTASRPWAGSCGWCVGCGRRSSPRTTTSADTAIPTHPRRAHGKSEPSSGRAHPDAYPEQIGEEDGSSRGSPSSCTRRCSTSHAASCSRISSTSAVSRHGGRPGR